MRVERVFTNLSCNQNCAFCNSRAPRDDRAFVAPAAVRRRIDSAVAAGAETVILTGGEPTMRRDLADLVAYAKERRASRVELETNGTLIDDGRAAGLADAGLDVARVHLPTWGPALDDVTRDPGGFEATRRGVEALSRAGIPIEASAPVVTSNLESLPQLPQRLVDAGIDVRALVLGAPYESPDDLSLVPLPRAAAVVEATEASCRRAGIELRLDQHSALPPCLFSHPAKLGRLFSLTPGGAEREDWVKPEICGGCVMNDRCPGFPRVALDRFDLEDARPIESDRTRRRLSVISTVDDQIRRELFQEDVRRGFGGERIYSRIVRVNFRCNQACDFCFVSTHLPTAEDEAVEAAIRDIASRRGELIVSGGEPTLNARLVEYVRMGKELGARRIELQTNATRLSDPELTSRLVEAGVDDFFVSLHGARADTSDRVTNAPGTFDKTLAGVDELVRQGAHVRLNFVFCQLNLTEFPDYIRMVSERWGDLRTTVSFVAPSTDVVPQTPELIPRYRDVVPHLAEGLRRARDLGVSISGFESMCGIPLCLVPDDISSYFEVADIPEGFDRGEFVQSDACLRCDLQRKCFGVRRGYAELYGTDEFEPVRRTTASVRGA